MTGDSRPAVPEGAPDDRVELRSQHDARVEVFFGEATSTGCRVYAQSERTRETSAPMSGVLRGPFCAYANTLPTNHPFRVRNGLPPGTVEAWVPDPCFWTPAMPFLYKYSLERDFGDRRESISGWFGIRRLGREGVNLRFDSKRWVLRATRAEKIELGELKTWHETSLAAVIDGRYTGVSLDDASRTGRAAGRHDLNTLDDVENQVVRLREHAAVGMVILDREASFIEPRRFARNMLFGQRFRPGEPIRPDDWADVRACARCGGTLGRGGFRPPGAPGSAAPGRQRTFSTSTKRPRLVRPAPARSGRWWRELGRLYCLRRCID